MLGIYQIYFLAENQVCIVLFVCGKCQRTNSSDTSHVPIIDEDE